jgi:hypothetical protein
VIKGLIGALIGLLAGGAGGFAVGIFVYPYLFLADIVATEAFDAAGRRPIAAGEFIHANPRDPIHHGSGRVTVYSEAVHLHEDFEVGPGPAYHVYLVPQADVTPQTDVAGMPFLDLGRLRAFRGSQVYDVPAGTALADYGSVVIWCEQFSVLISPATLLPY